MFKIKVKPKRERSTESDGNLSMYHRAKVDLAKVQLYMEEQIDHFSKVSDYDVNNYLDSIKTFSELGQSILGFRWSTSFHVGDQVVKGSKENRARLLELCLVATIKIIKDKIETQKREDEGAYVAFSACLHFVAEVAALVTTVLFFLDSKTWQGWLFVSVSIAARFFQMVTVIFLQNASKLNIFEAAIGCLSISDAYRVLKEKKDYSQKTEVGMSYAIAGPLRKMGTVIIQFIPQSIMNIHIIINMVETNQDIGAVIWVQLIAIASSILAFAMSLSLFNSKQMTSYATRNIYKSISGYIPKDKGDQRVINTASTLWYLMHSIVVHIAVGTLTSRAPLSVSISIIGGFIFVVNLLRAIINRGELRFYRRMKPTILNNFLSIFGSALLYGVGTAFLPLSMNRFHSGLGPTIYGFVWIFSFGTSIAVVFYFVKNISLLGIFGVFCCLYIGALTVFFAYCRDGTWKTFIFSKTNWKGVLRDELWKDVNYGSAYWNQDLLLDNEDAHYAGLVAQYLTSDLPWDKLRFWLLAKKQKFLYEPPVWFTESWLLLIPKAIQDEIWNADEMAILIDTINTIREGHTSNILAPSWITDVTTKRFSKSKDKLPKQQRTTSRSSNNLGSVLEVNEQISPAWITRKTPEQLRRTLSCGLHNDNDRKLESLALLVPVEKYSGEHKLRDLEVPLFLQNFIKQASLLPGYKMNDLIESAVKQDFAKAVIEEEEESFAVLVIAALLKHFRKEKEQNKNLSQVEKTVIAAFLEIADEVTDIVLTIIYLNEADTLQWAGILMIVFIVTRRIMGTGLSFFLGEPLICLIESFVGIKCISDSYRLLKRGAHYHQGSLPLISSRMFDIGAGILFESFPQMVLQLAIVFQEMKGGDVESGVLFAQIASVVASCLSLGMSVGYISVVQVKSMKNKHPSACACFKKREGGPVLKLRKQALGLKKDEDDGKAFNRALTSTTSRFRRSSIETEFMKDSARKRCKHFVLGMGPVAIVNGLIIDWIWDAAHTGGLSHRKKWFIKKREALRASQRKAHIAKVEMDLKLSQQQIETAEKFAEKSKNDVLASWQISNATEVQLGELLGKGQFGSVYACEYKGRLLAAKCMTNVSEDNLKLFRDEAILMAQLQHPSIVRMVACCLKPPRIMVLMEYAGNGTLCDLLYHKDAFWGGLLCKSLIEVISGLRFLHERPQPIIHRDLKSVNILVTETYTTKLADFGNSTIQVEREAMTLVGTPYYIAPEVIRGETYTTSADMFSFAILTLECCFYLAFVSNGCKDLYKALSNKKITRVLMSQEKAKIIRTCWSHDPQKRFTASQVFEQLDKLNKDISKQKRMYNKLSMKYAKADQESFNQMSIMMARPTEHWDVVEDFLDDERKGGPKEKDFVEAGRKGIAAVTPLSTSTRVTSIPEEESFKEESFPISTPVTPLVEEPNGDEVTYNSQYAKKMGSDTTQNFAISSQQRDSSSSHLKVAYKLETLSDPKYDRIGRLTCYFPPGVGIRDLIYMLPFYNRAGGTA
eukprot:g1281.t1